MKYIFTALLNFTLCIMLFSMPAAASGSVSETVSDPPETICQKSDTEIPDTKVSDTETSGSASSDISPAESGSNTDSDSASVLSGRKSVFKIDNKNIYDGMDESFQKGYTPQVKNGKVSVILPLTSNCELKDNQLSAVLDLGELTNSPFIYKNYQKTVFLSSQKINQTDKTEAIYYIRFDLPLIEKRINGVYPVIISVSAENTDNQEITGEFTVYVTINDGTAPETQSGPGEHFSGSSEELFGSSEEISGSGEELSGSGDGVGSDDGNGQPRETKPVSQPIVLVSGSTCKPAIPEAGKSFQVTVHLTNTSEKKSIQNMVITVSCDNSDLILLNDTNTIYVEKLNKNSTTDIVLKYQAGKNITEGRYTINLSMSYDNEDAETLSSAGNIIIPVKQPLSVKMNMSSVASSVTAGDTISLDFQFMNLGRSKAYNVRCEVSGPGLFPMNTAFIGDMEPGTSSDASMNIFAGSKQAAGASEDDQSEAYGPTTGTVTLIYEDADGKEYTETSSFHTSIDQPVILSSGTDNDDTRKRTNQWWISICIAGSLLLTGGIALYILKRKQQKELR